MKKLAVVQDKLTKQGRFGRWAAVADDIGDHAAQGRSAVVLDGPYAETKEQLLGFYLVDCKNLDEALDVAAISGAANPGGAYEIAPSACFQAGEHGEVTDAPGSMPH